MRQDGPSEPRSLGLHGGRSWAAMQDQSAGEGEGRSLAAMGRSSRKSYDGNHSGRGERGLQHGSSVGRESDGREKAVRQSSHGAADLDGMAEEKPQARPSMHKIKTFRDIVKVAQNRVRAQKVGARSRVEERWG